MRFLLGILFSIIAIPALAQQVDSSSFSIRLFGLNDTDPPTTPVLLTAVPVATSQIDITWGASTDDFYLSGYVVSRDGVPVATTTQTNFSDIGLIASTTYSYTVSAFDSSFNYSSSSNALAATTDSVVVIPPVTPDTDSPSGTAVRTVLESFNLTPNLNSAVIDLTTTRPARIEVRWGRTGSYELGYIANETYLRTFTSTISDLEPGTQYEYEVIGYSARGIATILKQGQFTTLTQSNVAPANVTFFTATIDGTSARLDWGLPDGDVAYVRLVRNHLGYPVRPNDGAIVYQGSGTTFLDNRILEQFSPVHYTLFVYDSYGNISSGAIVRIGLNEDGNGVVLPPDATVETPIKTEDGVDIFTPEATTSDEFNPEAVRIPNNSEIQIITETTVQSFADVDIVIAKNKIYTISIPVSAVSNNLKTITVSFTDPVDERIYSYILRINKARTAYEAVINPLHKSGTSEFTVAVYDYEAKIMARYQKRVMFGEVDRSEETVFFPDYFYKHPAILYALAGLLALILIILLWLRIRRRDSN